MSYTITLTDGATLTTISNTSVDNTTSLTLLGKNYSGYGAYMAENFVHLLENFAYTSAPSAPLVGQLWYNTNTNVMEVWNGSAWVSIVPVVPVVPEVANIVSLPAPASATSPLYYVDSGSNGLPVLASRLGSNWYYYNASFNQYATDTGTVNNLVGSISPSPSSLAAITGVPFYLKIGYSNTGNVTLTLNTFATTPVLNPDYTQINPLHLNAGGIYEFVYDGMNFQLISPTTLSAVRVRLTAAMTIYVASTGSDSNTGLSSGSPFLTLQKAWNFIVTNFDLNGYTITVSVGAGTYAPVSFSGNATGYGTVIFQSYNNNPETCIISAVNTSCITLSTSTQIQFSGFKLTSTGSSGPNQGCGVLAGNNSVTQLSSMDFGTCVFAQIYSLDNSQVSLTGTIYISGNSPYHMITELSASIVYYANIQFLASVTLGIFAAAVQNSVIIMNTGVAIYGTCTGTRFLVEFGGGINTNTSGNVNFFPGTIAGDVNGTSSWYN